MRRPAEPDSRVRFSVPASMNYPRVLIGCPTADVKEYCLQQYMDGLQTITYPNFDIAIEDNSKTNDYAHRLKIIAEQWNQSHSDSKFSVIESGFTSPKARDRLVKGRNILRKKVLDEGYDYFLSLEQDVIPPANVIERMLETKHNVISAGYFTIFPNYPSVRLIAFRHVPPANPDDPIWDVGEPFGIMAVLPSRIIDCAAIGLGCVLIHRDVLEKVEFRYDPATDATDDAFFSYDARKAGYPVYLDSGLLCQHYYNSWGTEYRQKGIY